MSVNLTDLNYSQTNRFEHSRSDSANSANNSSGHVCRGHSDSDSQRIAALSRKVDEANRLFNSIHLQLEEYKRANPSAEHRTYELLKNADTVMARSRITVAKTKELLNYSFFSRLLSPFTLFASLLKRVLSFN